MMTMAYPKGYATYHNSVIWHITASLQLPNLERIKRFYNKQNKEINDGTSTHLVR